MQELPQPSLGNSRNRDASNTFAAHGLVLGHLALRNRQTRHLGMNWLDSLIYPMKSAWYLLERICSAMQERDQDYLLQEIIEMDKNLSGRS